MSQQHPHQLEQNQCPRRLQNPRLRNLRRRIRAVRKWRPVDRQPALYALNGNEETAADPDSERRNTRPPVERNDVVLNFQNMDQDCALRPVTSHSTIDTSDTLDSLEAFRRTSIDRPVLRPQSPNVEPAGHPRLTTDEKGQLRYFGYSSLMRIVSILPPSSPSNSTISTAAASGAEALNETGQDMVTLADSPETHHHLMDLFFQYQNAALPILDETAFRKSYARNMRTEYYSNFLLHSILLRAIKFATIPHADKLKSIYLRRIRDEILFEIENPSIATIPALCMFGSYLAGEGSDRGCWLYPGLAFRLLYDFGLHEDCVNLVESGRLTEVERRTRLSILYHCYIFDKLYSSYQGRPTAIRLEDFSCPLPSEEILGSQGQLTAALVHLSSILEDILPIVNGRRLETIYQQTSIAKLSRASENLLEWFKSLPRELQWSSGTHQHPSPAISALHVNFLFITILLNRPFAAYMLRSANNKRKTGGCFGKRRLNGQTPEASQKLCTTSGIRISKILSTYRLHHGANKFFSTINPPCLSAAMALMSDIVSAEPGENKAEEKRWLTAILESLKEITPTYPVGGRSYMVLCAIAKACALSEVVPLSSSIPLEASDSGNGLLDQHSQHLQEPQAGADELIWSMDDSLGWEFYPMLDSVQDLGLNEFHTRLSPWQPPAPEYGNWIGGGI